MTRRRLVTYIASAIVALVAVFIYFVTHYGPGGMSDFRAKIAGDYYIHRNSSHEIFISPEFWDDKTPIISAKVIECNADKRFIIAKRQGLKRRNPRDQNDTVELPDPAVYDYWILDTVAPKVFGPLDFNSFNIKRKELGVSESLALKDVYSFKPLL